ncbi:MAG TPA: hypothetical protein VGE72_29255, partial [Azospirillum sp.]
MADTEDTTRAPASRRETPAPAGEPVSEGMRLLDDLMPTLALNLENPRHRAAAQRYAAAQDRLRALRPECLGDAVALLLAVAVAGGEHRTPDDIGMIGAAVGFLTRRAPGLRRPRVLRRAMAQARAAF